MGANAGRGRPTPLEQLQGVRIDAVADSDIA